MPRDDTVYANSTFTKVTTNGGTIDFGTSPIYTLTYKSTSYSGVSGDVIDLLARTYTFVSYTAKYIDTGSCIVCQVVWALTGTSGLANKYEITLPSAMPTPTNIVSGCGSAFRSDASTINELLVCLVLTTKKLRMSANNQTTLDSSGTSQDYSFNAGKAYTACLQFSFFY